MNIGSAHRDHSGNIELLRQPVAFIPLAMSLCALAMVLVHAAIYGVVHQADEGAAAHVFQLLMVVQVPIIAIFAVKWFPRSPAGTMQVLGLQAVAAVAAFAAVFFLT